MTQSFDRATDRTSRQHTQAILIIEDNPDMLSIFGEICELHGYDVLLAASGQAGLNLAREHPPVRVICDLFLPDMHGNDVLRQLRQHPVTATTPVIFTTGDIRYKPPVDEYLQILHKPFSVEAFLTLIS